MKNEYSRFFSQKQYDRRRKKQVIKINAECDHLRKVCAALEKGLRKGVRKGVKGKVQALRWALYDANLEISIRDTKQKQLFFAIKNI